MDKRAYYYEEYLLIKEAHRSYPNFDELSELEKVAVLKQLRSAKRAISSGAKKVGDAYTHTGQRIGAKLESMDIPVNRAMQQLNTAGYVAHAGGGAAGGAASLAAGTVTARAATKAAKRAKMLEKHKSWQKLQANTGTQGPAPRNPYAKDRFKHKPFKLETRDKALRRYDNLTNEGHLGSINTAAADAAPGVYNATGRLTPASVFGF
jgi:hypothetical protein